MEKEYQRLNELKATLIELETNERLTSPNTINFLEDLLKRETSKLVNLKQRIELDVEQKKKKENAILKYNRDAKFYKSQSSLNQGDINKLASTEASLIELEQTIEKKRECLKSIKKSLEEFDFEPTNEALSKKIDDLKKSRISLSELTFTDD